MVAVVVFFAVGATTRSAPHVASSCTELFVPAFFYPGPAWVQLDQSKPVPSTLILDVSGTGAGSSPNPTFLAAVKRAKGAGITILGYVSTAYDHRSSTAVEADVRNYKAWYGVTDIFLDEVTSSAQYVPYYRALDDYIHHVNPGSTVWLNPGIFPNELYMSVANVVMVFEGSYATYLKLVVPSWVDSYPASRFAHTVYATTSSELSNAARLARSRHAGYLYVTDGSGSNPYSSLPSYWSSEDALECR
jgi:hypothetical protein